MNESCKTFTSVMSRLEMSHVTQSESHYISECFQRALLELIGFSEEKSNSGSGNFMARSLVLARLEERESEVQVFF